MHHYHARYHLVWLTALLKNALIVPKDANQSPLIERFEKYKFGSSNIYSWNTSCQVKQTAASLLSSLLSCNLHKGEQYDTKKGLVPSI